MTTKLLVSIRSQEQAELAKRHNEGGRERRQPRRRWCVDELRPTLTEPEYEAGRRAVRECILYYPGAKPSLDRVDSGWSDAALVSQMDAGRALYALRQAVSLRGHKRQAIVCDLIVQLYTMAEVARALGLARSMGARRPVADMRLTKPLVRATLSTMARYYADCCPVDSTRAYT